MATNFPYLYPAGYTHTYTFTPKVFIERADNPFQGRLKGLNIQIEYFEPVTHLLDFNATGDLPGKTPFSFSSMVKVCHILATLKCFQGIFYIKFNRIKASFRKIIFRLTVHNAYFPRCQSQPSFIPCLFDFSTLNPRCQFVGFFLSQEH